MNKSESITNLAVALVKVQGELKDTHKLTPANKYKYSDLSQILTYTRPILLANELSITQLVAGESAETIGVETMLLHSSGEYISSTAYMSVPKTVIAYGKEIPSNLAQQAGSVITYLRRYQYAAIIGLTQSDNDASDAPTPSEQVAEQNEIKASREQEMLGVAKCVEDLRLHCKNNDSASVKDMWDSLNTDMKSQVWGSMNNELHSQVKLLLE